MASSDPGRGGATLEARGLGFRYPTHRALEDIDLTVSRGEVVGVLGPNGSGKSTLIRVLSGVLGEYSGSVRLNGIEIAGFPRRDLARALAVVPQEPVFGFPFTALEVALMGRHPHLSGLAFETERDIRLGLEALER